MGFLRHVPAVLLASEFFIAAIGRLVPALRTFHGRVRRKSLLTAPALYPMVPFRDDVRAHMRYVGAWLLLTGLLVAIPATRGSRVTLGLVVFWTGAGAWSQWKCGMAYRVPVFNMALGALVFWLEQGR
ncbi:hypothetical protein F5X68DRAFT_137455 [Plectosphaerella plurivora]|uniref:DoxX family protein n=1 Tax=Plectosphaerella plurivora TaxID=936078 RepID=A0A9P8V642_9PEZI|nr:hypothetical protein F5X68DRAFT_137455 [Plectosphaerella plurivora]